MNESGTRRLRIFAGPNGSGKTTLYDYLTSKRYFKIYYHINADKITEELPIGLNLESYPIQFDEQILKNYLSESPFQQKTKESFADLISVSGKTFYAERQRISPIFLQPLLNSYDRKCSSLVHLSLSNQSSRILQK